MRRTRCSSSSRFAASARPKTFRPEASIALYEKSIQLFPTFALLCGMQCRYAAHPGFPLSHSIGEIDDANQFLDAGDATPCKPDAIFREGREPAASRRRKNVRGVGAARDQL